MSELSGNERPRIAERLYGQPCETAQLRRINTLFCNIYNDCPGDKVGAWKETYVGDHAVMRTYKYRYYDGSYDYILSHSVEHEDVGPLTTSFVFNCSQAGQFTLDRLLFHDTKVTKLEESLDAVAYDDEDAKTKIILKLEKTETKQNSWLIEQADNAHNDTTGNSRDDTASYLDAEELLIMLNIVWEEEQYARKINEYGDSDS